MKRVNFNVACNATYMSRVDIPGYGDVRFKVACVGTYRSHLDVPDNVKEEVFPEYIQERLDECSIESEISFVSDWENDAVTMEDIIDLPKEKDKAKMVLEYIYDHLNECPVLSELEAFEDLPQEAVTHEDIREILDIVA